MIVDVRTTSRSEAIEVTLGDRFLEMEIFKAFAAKTICFLFLRCDNRILKQYLFGIVEYLLCIPSIYWALTRVCHSHLFFYASEYADLLEERLLFLFSGGV